jgi:hypothetical protein
MSENHLSNLIEKLASAEAELEEDKKVRESKRFLLNEACKNNMKMRDIELIEESLSKINDKVNYDHSLILALRRRIKRAS